MCPIGNIASAPEPCPASGRHAVLRPAVRRTGRRALCVRAPRAVARRLGPGAMAAAGFLAGAAGGHLRDNGGGWPDLCSGKREHVQRRCPHPVPISRIPLTSLLVPQVRRSNPSVGTNSRDRPCPNRIGDTVPPHRRPGCASSDRLWPMCGSPCIGITTPGALTARRSGFGLRRSAFPIG